MNALRHDQATMTPKEAEAIVARVMARAEPTSDGPSVADVAEALRLPQEEISRMLTDIRSLPPQQLKRHSNRREARIWMLSGVLAIAIMGVTLGWMHSFREGPWSNAKLIVRTTSPAMEARSYQPTAPSEGTATATAMPPEQVFRVFINGTDMGSGLQADLQNGDSQKIPERFEDWIKTDPSQMQPGTTSVADPNPEGSRAAAKAGEWKSVAGLSMATLDIKRPNDQGRFMRWATANIPIYLGDDALIADAVRAERLRRVQAAVDAAIKGLSDPDAGEKVAIRSGA